MWAYADDIAASNAITKTNWSNNAQKIEESRHELWLTVNDTKTVCIKISAWKDRRTAQNFQKEKSYTNDIITIHITRMAS